MYKTRYNFKFDLENERIAGQFRAKHTFSL